MALSVLEIWPARAPTVSQVATLDDLKERALALDAPGLEEMLRALNDDERAQARSWVLADNEFFASVRDHEPQVSRSDDPRWAELGSGAWIRIMCLVALCSPAEAARAIRWGEVWSYMTPVAREHTRRLLADRPAEWARTFLATTAGLRLSTNDSRGCMQLAWLVSRGLADHDLPCPDGLTFLAYDGRFSRNFRDELAQFRANRLNPDQVYLKIAAGFAADYDALHEAVDELIGEGSLDRCRLLESCLQTLTIQTRVGAQRVVAKIMAALNLRPTDVPGGLSFLASVVATCDGSVGAALLPVALQTIIDTAGRAAGGTIGLEELTRVIAGRREVKQKQVLLAWLRRPATVVAVGMAEVLVALEVLADGQEEASLLRSIEAARANLGASAPTTEPPGDVLGLWQLAIDPGPPPEAPVWLDEYRPSTLTSFLNRHQEDYKPATEYHVEKFIHELTTDNRVDDFVALCKRLRLEGNLALTRCIRLLEPAFLAGGLRIVWPAALDIADDIASAGRILAGLPELLRLLTRYAPEVPDGWSLPPHLAQLAAASGNTKSQLEARALGAALARVEAADYTQTEVEQPATVVRGLWDMRPQGPVLGLLLNPHFSHYRGSDSDLMYSLAIGNGLATRFRVPYPGIVTDAHLVELLATAVQTGDLDAVRNRIARVPRLPESDHGPTGRALQLWQHGHLTARTYDDVLAADRVQGPSALDRVVFGWTCEQLVRLPTHPGLLSRPGATDGSVVVPMLVNQLRSFAGIATVGPLDLLLTLTRLNVEPGDADQALNALREVPSVWTDPAVTRTTSGVKSFDVVPVIRAWIADGGMTETTVPVDLGLFTGLSELGLRGPASHQDVLRRVWPRDPRLPETPFVRYTYEDRFELQGGRLPAQAWARLLSGVIWQREDTALTHIVELARFDGVLDEAVTVPVALSALSDGDLPLGPFSDGLHWLFERGGLRQLWPLGMAVAAAAGDRTRKPAGLAFLLSCLATYAPEVPAAARTVPPEVAALAAAASATKSRAAARDLVAALGADTQSKTTADTLSNTARSSGTRNPKPGESW